MANQTNEAIERQMREPRSLVVTYDVTGWTDRQIAALEGEAHAQGENNKEDDEFWHGSASVDSFLAKGLHGDVRDALKASVVENTECPFCAMQVDEKPDTFVAANRAVFVVEAKDKKAAMHLLVVPRKHVKTILNVEPQLALAAHEMIARVAIKFELDEGFRVVVNTGRAGKQVVPHVHWHVLAGPEVLADGFTGTVS